MSNVEIISDGTSKGTHVFLESGQKIVGITKIEISDITPGGLVSAKITLNSVSLSMLAKADIVVEHPYK